MENKLKLLLEQIELGEDKYSFFEDGKLIKIVGNKNKDNYVFFIELVNHLPISLYLELLDLIGKKYLDIGVELALQVTNFSNELYVEYYRHFMKEYSLSNPLLEMFTNVPLDISNQVLIKVNNLAEKMKFDSILLSLEADLSKAGFSIPIVLDIDMEQSNEIVNQIKDELEAPVVIPEVKVEEPKEEGKKRFIPKDYKRPPLISDPLNEKVIVGREIDDIPVRLDTVVMPGGVTTIEGYLFADPVVREARSGLKIISLKITDFTDSIYGTLFVHDDDEFKMIIKKLSKDSWYKIRASVKDKDQYNQDVSLLVRDINVLNKEEAEEIIDDAPIRRVELHSHTMMSQMDGLVNEEVLVSQAHKWGHKAIGITDHHGCQAFPHVYNLVKKLNRGKEGNERFKAIYGAEMVLIDDTVKIVLRPDDNKLLDNTYVVFDVETTGFNAGGGDSMIEIGAVKICNGEIIDRFDELINPGRKLPKKITELTEITDEMLEDKPGEEEVVKRFIEWFADLPMVAHNAKFDVSFLEIAYQKYNLGTFKNTVIDTLELSRTMDNTYARHGLSAIVKRYGVPWDETAHHRADYDSEGTALVFHKMLKKLNASNYETVRDLEKLVSKDEIHKYGRAFHCNLLALNKTGLKNLFKIVSFSNTTYLYKTPRVLRSKIEELREGILVGSGCYQSEVFNEARSKSDEELTNIINFYDYVEVQPPEVYDHLLQMGDFGSLGELQENIEKVIRGTKEAGKIIVATGDVHHLKRSDKIYREIIVNQKVPGGGRHPLAKKNINSIPSQHLRTTREMLEDFAFLGEDLAYEIVVENTNKIADMVEEIEVIIETGGVPFSPKIDKSVETVTELVYDKAKEWYGDPLPLLIEERIAKELYGDAVYNSIREEILDKDPKLDEEALSLKVFEEVHDVILLGFDAVKDVIRKNILKHDSALVGEEIEKKVKKALGGIIGGGFDVIYLISQKLVKKSNDEGFLVGSRGSVGSSFVATMMSITEVNPLAAHYRCPKCQHSIFEDESGESLGSKYSCGFDLPDTDCPKCGTKMIKDGQDMPFATFLGFNADKVPDIDLNFSDLNQADAHDYTKVLFGIDNVYRAGTIGTVADKTAFGYVKGYCEDKNIVMRTAEVERMAMGCTGVKRTTGQHPGGIVVIPDYMDVFDFTPFQYPADDANSAWRTTHFDYHSLEDDVLKLDILGHSDPTQLRLIQDMTSMDVTTVPMDDKKTMGIFLSPEPLGVTKEQILCETGTLGIPEFGTKFTLQMLADTRPKTFSELIKISGLSHGTDVWLGNAQELIQNKTVPFSEVIGCRDDIMVYLMYHGVEPIKAFKIMEFVRKGRAAKQKGDDANLWQEYVEIMKEKNIEEWYINSCAKIKYMFPKAHAAAYVISAFRIAWYKVNMPVYFYASWFSTKATDFDIDAMIGGYNEIKNRLIEIKNKGNEATNKDNGVYESLHVALEATARGINFTNIDLYESEALTFKVKDETTIYPPFASIDGLGDTVAKNIINEREKGEFLSIEDLQKRAKISTTLIERMRLMGIFEGMDESSQLTLF